MTLLNAISNRHSVRNYLDKPLNEETIELLKREIEICNKESGLNIQLVVNEPKAFDGIMAHYGKFDGVQNYIALTGEKSKNTEERIGYYGEKIALYAQILGLNTCWVAMTFSKKDCKKICNFNPNEKLYCVLSLGYGKTNGISHTSKSIESLSNYTSSMPDWFYNGMKAASLPPPALNHQKFYFTLKINNVIPKSLVGFFSKFDLVTFKYLFGKATEKAL